MTNKNALPAKKKMNPLKWGCIFIFVIILLAALDFITYPAFHAPSIASFNKGNNAIWIRYLWYFGKHTDAELDEMLNKLKNGQIKFAYYHVHKTNKDGTLKHKFLDHARKLIKATHEKVADSKVLPWVYVPSKYGRADGVDLADPTTRKNLIDTAKWLVNDCEFDGVQWDYEFAPNNDQDFLALLAETKQAIGSNKMLSVCTPMWYPGTLHGWNDDYFKKVASGCDQIAVMCYDSFLYMPSAYVALIKQQVIHVTQAVAESNSNGRVILGVPVYDTDTGTPGHLTQAENIVRAIEGIKEGLSDRSAHPEVFDGIAPFAEYTMDDMEWEQYHKWWQGSRCQKF